MIEITGKYGTAKVYASSVDETTSAQILNILNSVVSEDANIRIMPDCHLLK